MTNANVVDEWQPKLTLPQDACLRCSGTTFWLTSGNTIARCPQIQMNLPHAGPSDAAQVVEYAARRLKRQGVVLMRDDFDLAQILTHYTTENPCSRQALMRRFFLGTNLPAANQTRKLQAMIERLRTVWLLPVGSRKADPCGYWIITDLDDYKDWFSRTTAAPITQLTTIHRNAKHNFPVFAEQIELDFFGNTEAENVG